MTQVLAALGENVSPLRRLLDHQFTDVDLAIGKARAALIAASTKATLAEGLYLFRITAFLQPGLPQGKTPRRSQADMGPWPSDVLPVVRQPFSFNCFVPRSTHGRVVLPFQFQEQILIGSRLLTAKEGSCSLCSNTSPPSWLIPDPGNVASSVTDGARASRD